MILSFSDNELNVSYKSERVPSNSIRQKSYGMTHDTIFQPTCRIRLFSSNLSDRVARVLYDVLQVKVTNPKRYLVRPNSGTLNVREHRTVDVIINCEPNGRHFSSCEYSTV